MYNRLTGEFIVHKNLVIILLIFLIPLGLYWFLTKDRTIATQQTIAGTNGMPEIIKFASPLCLECQELESVFENVYPQYASKIVLKKVDVSVRDKNTKQIMKEYNIQLVPTTIIKNSQGIVTKRFEGTTTSENLKNYIKEAINE